MTTNTATEALLHKGSGLQVVVGLGQSGLSVARWPCSTFLVLCCISLCGSCRES